MLKTSVLYTMFETNAVQFQTTDEEIINHEEKSTNISDVDTVEMKTTVKSVDFDELLPYAGEFGLYQVLLFSATLPFYIFFATVYYIQIFLTEVPKEHWCWVPELENLTALERRTLAIPGDAATSFGYSRCTAYDANWTQVLTTMSPPELSTPTVKCQHGWEYNMTDIPYPTTSVDMDWVCDKDNYQAAAQSVFFVGSVVGSLVFGWISDRYGRIPVTVLSNLVGCVGGVCTAFTQNFWQFTLTRFIVGLAYDNCAMMIYILVIEYTAPKYRTIMSNTSFALFYTIGVCALPWFSLACGHWRIIAVATSAPMAIALVTPFVVPESPRWLLSKGRVEDAVQKLKTVARINKKIVPEDLIDDFRVSSLKTDNEVEKVSLLDLFKTPVLRKTFILICLLYMLTSIVFDCLVRIVESAGSDLFISFTIASMTELPSILLLIFVMDRLGRRWMSAGCFAISCIFIILSAFTPKGGASLACVVIARFTSNMTYNGVIQWVPELMPSGARGSGTSFTHMCGYLAAIVAPYVIYLGHIHSYLPPLIIGALAAVAGLIALLIAETAGQPLPHSCADAELMMTNQRFWEIPCSKKNEPSEN